MNKVQRNAGRFFSDLYMKYKEEAINKIFVTIKNIMPIGPIIPENKYIIIFLN